MQTVSDRSLSLLLQQPVLTDVPSVALLVVLEGDHAVVAVHSGLDRGRVDAGRKFAAAKQGKVSGPLAVRFPVIPLRIINFQCEIASWLAGNCREGNFFLRRAAGEL